MKELGITKGEWVAEQYGGYFTIQDRIGYEGNDLLSSEGVGSFTAEHNAELCCDAGNTAQKCGLLPSELLQQRDELKDAINSLLFMATGKGTACGDLNWDMAERRAIAAIKSTER